MEYFINCVSAEEGKREYRRLVMKYHPDVGGDLETMKDINTQYEKFKARGTAAYKSFTYQEPARAQKKPRKPKRKRYYTAKAVNDVVEQAKRNGGTVRTYGDTVVIIQDRYKTIVAKPVPERRSENLYTVRQYNETPEKYKM